MEIKDLGGLSEPAGKLIDRCSEALGAMAHPYQIVRIANAEVKAAQIKAKGEIEVSKIKMLGDIELSEIQQRAMERVLHTAEREQQNIEDIFAKALPEVKEDAKPEEVEDDWYANFFDKSRLVSDEEMQMLWGKVLAGEVNKPRTFSRRTLSLLSDLHKKDAENFLLLCRFSMTENNIPTIPLIYKFTDEIFSNSGLNLYKLENFAAMGLIIFTVTGTVSQGLKDINPMRFHYHSTVFNLDFPGDWNGNFLRGQVMFTDLGSQFARLCSPEPYPGFEDYLVSKWKGRGYKVTIQREGEAPRRARRERFAV